MMDIFKEFTFDAAHQINTFPEGHKCRRLHGHTYRVRVYVRGRVEEETGRVIDFEELSTVWNRECFPVLDHHYLNEVEGLEVPTAENLCFWIWDKLAPHLKVSKVVVFESCDAGASYFGWDRKAETVRTPPSRPRDSTEGGSPS